MKLLIIARNNDYCYREYSDFLIKEKVDFDLILIGEKSNNKINRTRTDNLWKPLYQSKILNKRNHFFFESLNCKSLLFLIKKMKYDLCLQGGGLGKIKPNFFNLFKIGVLNCHPGKLPKYRGSSAPEYQIFDKKKIVATYHLIGNEIDSGRMIKKIELNLDYSSFYKMRASLYSAMSQNLIIVFNIINKSKISSFKKININKYLIRPYIGNRRIEYLIINWNSLIFEI